LARLGVNVDHIANIREARKAVEPEPIAAALIAEMNGATGITVHLRGDRRHIQDRDLMLLREVVKTSLNLEMSPADEMLKIACEVCPDMVTLVPEAANEITTEGGLSFRDAKSDIAQAVKRLKEANINVSLFVNPDVGSMEEAKDIGADTVEIHTGIYAAAFGTDKEALEFSRVVRCVERATELGLSVNAGHDLNYRNILPVAQIPNMGELNIGHSIIARSVFVGIGQAVKEMFDLICLTGLPKV